MVTKVILEIPCQVTEWPRSVQVNVCSVRWIDLIMPILSSISILTQYSCELRALIRTK